MMTTRPPFSRKMLVVLSVVATLAGCLLFLVLGYFAGGFVLPQQYHSALVNLELSREEAATLKAENQELKQANVDLSSEAETSRGKISMMEKQVREIQGQVTVFKSRAKEQQFVADRRDLDTRSLARQLYELEGLDVRITQNGILVSAITSPFRLGSSRLEDDALMEKLDGIAKAYNEANASGGTQFYAAAVGNTDATPVLASSLHGSNLWLGAKRARTLAQAMRDGGFPDGEIFLISWGSIQAGDKNFDPESRRAELFITPRDTFLAVADAQKKPQGDQPKQTSPAQN